MIEIIKRGTKTIVTCKKCGCVFSYEDEDVQQKDLDNYKAFADIVVCPQCETEIEIRAVRS